MRTSNEDFCVVASSPVWYPDERRPVTLLICRNRNQAITLSYNYKNLHEYIYIIITLKTLFDKLNVQLRPFWRIYTH